MRNSILRAGGWFALGLALITGLPARAADGFAMTLEGETLVGAVESIDPDGRVKIGPNTSELEALRYIAPKQAPDGEALPEADESPLRIILVCGSDLRAKDLIFDDETFVFNSASAGKELEIPVDSVRAIRLALPIEGSRFEQTLAFELLVDFANRVEGDVELIGQLARRRQRVLDLIEPARDPESKLLPELLLK